MTDVGSPLFFGYTYKPNIRHAFASFLHADISTVFQNQEHINNLIHSRDDVSDYKLAREILSLDYAIDARKPFFTQIKKVYTFHQLCIGNIDSLLDENAMLGTESDSLIDDDDQFCPQPWKNDYNPCVIAAHNIVGQISGIWRASQDTLHRHIEKLGQNICELVADANSSTPTTLAESSTIGMQSSQAQFNYGTSQHSGHGLVSNSGNLYTATTKTFATPLGIFTFYSALDTERLNGTKLANRVYDTLIAGIHDNVAPEELTQDLIDILTTNAKLALVMESYRREQHALLFANKEIDPITAQLIAESRLLDVD